MRKQKFGVMSLPVLSYVQLALTALSRKVNRLFRGGAFLVGEKGTNMRLIDR
jgi:hypothetical protein